MPDGLSIDGGELVGLFVEAVFYGIYLVTFGNALVCILRSPTEDGWKVPKGIRCGTLIVALTLCINCTLNISWGLQRTMEVYLFGSGNSTWINIAKSFTVNTQTLLADIFLIYRCWIVYGRSWKMIIFSTILWIEGTILSVYLLYVQTRGALEVGIPKNKIYCILCSQWATTIAANIYATASIVYRIYVTDRESGLHATMHSLVGKQRTPLQRSMRIIIESALLYTLVSIAAFASVVAQSNSSFITTAMEIMVVGITFNLIIIRLSHERDRERLELVVQSRLATLRFEHATSEHFARNTEIQNRDNSESRQLVEKEIKYAEKV